MSITRTVEVNDLTPAEVAYLFAEMDAEEQAQFFATIWQIAKAWGGAGWCQQSLAIVQKLDNDGRNAVSTLAAHLEPVA